MQRGAAKADAPTQMDPPERPKSFRGERAGRDRNLVPNGVPKPRDGPRHVAYGGYQQACLSWFRVHDVSTMPRVLESVAVLGFDRDAGLIHAAVSHVLVHFK
jgi:hypothetical protein